MVKVERSQYHRRTTVERLPELRVNTHLDGTSPRLGVQHLRHVLLPGHTENHVSVVCRIRTDPRSDSLPHLCADCVACPLLEDEADGVEQARIDGKHAVVSAE